jgi:hypothetical protein
MSMDDIAEQLAIRDRFLRRRQAAMTPVERLVRMQELQAQAWEILRNSPEGYANFIRRNFRKRAVDPHDNTA